MNVFTAQGLLGEAYIVIQQDPYPLSTVPHTRLFRLHIHTA